MEDNTTANQTPTPNLIAEHGTAEIRTRPRENTPFTVHMPPDDCMYDGDCEKLVVGGLNIMKFIPPADYSTELMVDIFEAGHHDVSEGFADLKIEHLSERNRFNVSFSAETKDSCLQALRDLISVVNALPSVGACEFETSTDGKEAA